MTLPKIYEDAINCFCPKTARMMRSSISRYITTGIIKISSRICTAPKAVLILIIHDIHQNFKYSLTERKCSSTEKNCSLNEENCSLTEKKCSLNEEERKEKNRDGKNTASLSPGPSISDTREGENIKDKEEEKGYISRTHAQENFQDQTNGEKNLHPNEILHPNENEENSNENENDRKGLNPLAARGAEDPTGKIAAARAEEEKITNPAPAENQSQKTQATTIPADPFNFETVTELKEEKILLHRMKCFRQMKDRIMKTKPKELIEFYNRETRGIFPPVKNIYPEIVMEARLALADIGMEKAREVIRTAKKDLFLQGDNSSGFIASFRWIFQDKRYYKILNGEFHDRKNFNFDKLRREQDYAKYFAQREAERRNGKRPASETVSW